MRKDKIMKKQKKLLNISTMVIDRLGGLERSGLNNIRVQLDQLCKKFDQPVRDLRLLSMSIEKGWLNAAGRVKDRIARDIDELYYKMQGFRELLGKNTARKCKLSDIYDELVQTQSDIGEVQIDCDSNTISVVTDPVNLNDIPLGPFEIALEINELAELYEFTPYRIIALEPNPAGANDEVTHPHVSEERLCEGDGSAAIRQALGDGRLCDFFTLIISILNTYNPGSPFVSLDEWEGVCCYDCGYTVSGDDRYYCEYCDRDYCSSCSTYCRICDRTVCLGCAYECLWCNKPVCVECTSKCKDCEEKFCNDCLNEEELCENCIEKRKENENEEYIRIKEALAEALPGSVGEAIVLSGCYA